MLALACLFSKYAPPPKKQEQENWKICALFSSQDCFHYFRYFFVPFEIYDKLTHFCEKEDY